MEEDLKNMLLSGIEKSLEKVFEIYPMEQHLTAAMQHSLFPSGKRIRPLFALAVCEDLGGSPSEHFPSVAPLELLHTSSLIHDDLPCLDNDDMRRGRPTCHKAYGEATALLAGDALIGLAFRMISDLSVGPARQVRLFKSLSQAYLSLCNGQQLDILPEVKRGEIEKIHFQKTGALFATSFEFGAVIAAAEEKTVDAAHALGMWFGFAFQVLDDFLDIYGDPSKRGRPSGSDERNEKKTFFTGRTKEEASFEIKKIIETLELRTKELKSYSPHNALPNTEALITSVLEPLR